MHFVCVGTPQRPGRARRRPHLRRGRDDRPRRHLTRKVLVVGKSTVPAGTAERMQRAAQRASAGAPGVELAWNPEFLREGFAVEDTLRPDRLVFGVRTGVGRAAAAGRVRAGDRDAARRWWSPTSPPPSWSRSRPTPSWPPRSRSSTRWPRSARPPAPTSPSWPTRSATTPGSAGGSSTPASASAAAACRRTSGRSSPGPRSSASTRRCRSCARSTQINLRRRARTVELGQEHAGRLATGGARVAVLGAAFKPNSDDIRDSPALDVAGRAAPASARTSSVYDPQAMRERPPGTPGAGRTPTRCTRPSAAPTWSCC